MNIITPDLLPALCASLTCPRALARLSETCKAARNYLLSPAGGHHWASAARAVCGDDHAQFGTTRPEHLRYAAMRMMCPWLSEPVELDAQYTSAEGRILELARVDYGYVRSDGALVLKARADGAGSEEEGMFVVPRPGAQGGVCEMQKVGRTDVQRFRFFERTVGDVEGKRVLGVLEAKKAMPRFGKDETVELVRIHDGAYAMIVRGAESASVMAFSRARMEMVRYMCCVGKTSRVFFSDAGEMWVVDVQTEGAYVEYHGAREDRKISVWADGQESCTKENNAPIWMCNNGQVLEAAQYVVRTFGAVDHHLEGTGPSGSLLGWAVEARDAKACATLFQYWEGLNTGGEWAARYELGRAIRGQAFGAAKVIETHFRKHATGTADRWFEPKFVPKLVEEHEGCFMVLSAQVTVALVMGANVNAVYLGGETALVKAAKKGWTWLVEILLQFGADTAIVDLDGKTAFEHFCTHPSAPRFAATLRALA